MEHLRASGIGITAVNTATGTKKWDVNCGDTLGGCAVGAGNVIIGVFQFGTGAPAKGIRDDGSTGAVIWTIPLDTANNSLSWPALLPNGDAVVQTEYGTIARVTGQLTPAPPIVWCNLQWPYTLNVVNTNTVITDTIYGQIWID